MAMKSLIIGTSSSNRKSCLYLRTILQSAIYLAGVMVSHAGQLILRVCENNTWTPAFLSSL